MRKRYQWLIGATAAAAVLAPVAYAGYGLADWGGAGFRPRPCLPLRIPGCLRCAGAPK